jgi:FkbM family methyltransferase
MLSRLRPLVEKSPFLATTYRSIRDEWTFRCHQFAPTPYGFMFMGNPTMQLGTFECQETALISEIIRDVEIFVDAGANVGFYSCLARSYGKHVVAFEPLAENLRCLFANLAANGWHDIEVFPVALGERPGLAQLYGGGSGGSRVRGWGGGSALYDRTVPMSTLDICLADRLAGRLLIKVDVEGGEYELLRGARQVLQRRPAPVWMVEIALTEHYPGGVNPRFVETFEAFWHLGYEAYTADASRTLVEPAHVVEWARARRRGFGSYNYLFLHAECPAF